MEVEKGQDAVIQIVFCSDPRPSRTSWEWGSFQLEAGKDRGRYVAENLAQVPCFSWDQHDPSKGGHSEVFGSGDLLGLAGKTDSWIYNSILKLLTSSF